jgi:putative Holliday junction resolvase
VPHGGRILAVDLGARRLGVAISDELGRLARPLGVVAVRGPRQDASAIRTLLKDLTVRRLVVGLPLLPSGEEGAAAAAARARAADLARRLQLPLDLVDERDTTRDAQALLLELGGSRRRRREQVDAMAAVLILETWLREHADP